MRTTLWLMALCMATIASTVASAQIPVPVEGAPARTGPLPTAPPPINPAHPPLKPPQLVEKSVHDLEHGHLGEAAKDDVTALRRGPLLIHGNYCGIGNRPGAPPIDALDAACMRHDACTKTGTLPGCACDQRLRIEATAVAEDPTTPPALRITAAATAAAIAVLVCVVPVPY